MKDETIIKAMRESRKEFDKVERTMELLAGGILITQLTALLLIVKYLQII